MIKATRSNGLHEEFMQDPAAVSYVVWLENEVKALRAALEECERERGAFEHAAQINHAQWCQANSDANALGAALMAAQSALRAGQVEMAQRILEI